LLVGPFFTPLPRGDFPMHHKKLPKGTCERLAGGSLTPISKTK
jgi:hypothetical protein